MHIDTTLLCLHYLILYKFVHDTEEKVQNSISLGLKALVVLIKLI